MPPKSKKAQSAAKKEKIEDKTFGLKNKNKSAKVQRFVQEVTHQAESAGNRKDLMAAEKRKKDIEDQKKFEEQRKKEMAGN
jgi:hypothetical protein